MLSEEKTIEIVSWSSCAPGLSENCVDAYIVVPDAQPLVHPFFSVRNLCVLLSAPCVCITSSIVIYGFIIILHSCAASLRISSLCEAQILRVKNLIFHTNPPFLKSDINLIFNTTFYVSKRGPILYIDPPLNINNSILLIVLLIS